MRIGHVNPGLLKSGIARFVKRVPCAAVCAGGGPGADGVADGRVAVCFQKDLWRRISKDIAGGGNGLHGGGTHLLGRVFVGGTDGKFNPPRTGGGEGGQVGGL